MWFSPGTDEANVPAFGNFAEIGGIETISVIPNNSWRGAADIKSAVATAKLGGQTCLKQALLN